MQHDLSKKIVTEIREKEIAPTPKWRFLAKEYSIWVIGTALLAVGSIAFSVVLYLTVNNDWDVRTVIADSLIGFVFITLPYFWLVLLVLFIIGAEYNVRHTKKGYKYTLPQIVIIVLIVTVVAGTVLYRAGFGRMIDTLLTEQVPDYYGPVAGNRHLRWQRPEQGRLAGRITRVDDDVFFLQDIGGTIWEVPLGNARIATGTVIFPDTIVKVIGYREEEYVFRATLIIRGDQGPGMLHFRNGVPMPIPRPESR